jgi:hypothetical protein
LEKGFAVPSYTGVIIGDCGGIYWRLAAKRLDLVTRRRRAALAYLPTLWRCCGRANNLSLGKCSSMLMSG